MIEMKELMTLKTKFSDTAKFSWDIHTQVMLSLVVFSLWEQSEVQIIEVVLLSEVHLDTTVLWKQRGMCNTDPPMKEPMIDKLNIFV